MFYPIEAWDTFATRLMLVYTIKLNPVDANTDNVSFIYKMNII